MPQSGADEPRSDDPRSDELRSDAVRPDLPRSDAAPRHGTPPIGEAPAARPDRSGGAAAPGPGPTASQPASQPASEPASQPASQPAFRPDGPADDEHPVFDALGEDEGSDAPPAPSGLRRAVTRVRERAAGWDDATRSTAFVPRSETVQIDVRRHPFVLLPSSLRTAAGLVVVVGGPRFWPMVVLAAATALWALVRLRTGLRRTATIAAGATVGTVVLLLVAGPVLCVLALLVWLLEDVADWWSDRLVVTDKRIYRRYGVVTGHSPSISLMAVAYIDAAVPPVGRLLHYGTLQLDSAAQEDAPLSRFDLVPDVVAVSHEILRLRSAAMPRFPLA